MSSEGYDYWDDEWHQFDFNEYVDDEEYEDDDEEEEDEDE